MLYILAFAGGVILGSLCTALYLIRKKVNGYFKIEPLEDEDGFYTVNVCITPNQNLLSKSSLILKRDPSQK